MPKKNVFNTATIMSRLAAPGIKWHRDDEDAIPLWLADTDFPLCPELKASLQKCVDQERTNYGSDQEAREAMQEKLKRVNKIDVPADQIMTTQGVTPGMWLSVRHACRPGDEVIITNPMYHPFLRSAEVTQTLPVSWHLDNGENRYVFDTERLKELITPKTKLIFVCNPHNPTGRAMTKDELKGIADVAVDNQIYVMVDELWEDVVYSGHTHITLASLNPEIADLTLTGWGFSKTWSIPGLQSGYLACTNKIMFLNIKRLATGILRGTNTFSHAIAPILLSKKVDYWKKDMIKHLEEIRDLVNRRLIKMGEVYVPDLEATYLMFPKFNWGMTSGEMYKNFKENAKIVLANGANFGSAGEGHMRILTATSESIMREAMDRLSAYKAKL